MRPSLEDLSRKRDMLSDEITQQRQEWSSAKPPPHWIREYGYLLLPLALLVALNPRLSLRLALGAMTLARMLADHGHSPERLLQDLTRRH